VNEIIISFENSDINALRDVIVDIIQPDKMNISFAEQNSRHL